MKAFQKLHFAGTLFVVSTVLLLAVSSCKQKPCIVPNPLIHFGLTKDTFGVTPSKVPNAQTVQIAAFDATGAPKGNFVVPPGQQQKMHFDTSAHRPIQLKFTYQGADGNTIAEDSVRIDDIVKKGVTLPDMDVVIGLIAPGNQTCPTVSTISPTITNEPGGLKKATFAWSPGDVFEVTLTCGNTVKKFLLKPTLGATEEEAGKVTIYGSNSYNCLTLTSSDAEPESPKAMIVTAISDDCTIRGWNDGSSLNLSVKYPSSCTIAVKK